jgi:hypothetical protein
MVTSDFSAQSYYQRTIRNVTRNAEYRSIEFGMSALTRQDTQFTLSREHSFGGRAKYAAYHAFFVRNGDKDRFAYPRVVAAFGTAGLDALWHPGQKQHTYEWSEAGCLLGRYLLRSYWIEFKPDIKRQGRKLLHRNAINPLD